MAVSHERSDGESMLQGSVSKHGFIMAIIAVLFIFQSPLEGLWGMFSYIDEFVAIMALPLTIVYWGQVKALLKQRKLFIAVVAFAVFIISGLTGNLIYHYQPWNAVMVDLFTNMKFYMALLTGYFLFPKMSWQVLRKYTSIVARFSSVLLMIIFFIDRLFKLYGSDVRYGIRSAKLFYSHPTYLAGALIFLLSILSITYKKTHTKYIVMDVVILMFTLRSKAVVGAAVYIFLYWYMLKRKRKLKIWQLVCIAIMAILLAWQQIYFYYIALAGEGARSALTLTGFQILKDYFPIGSGFGTFASHVAAEHYSPLYIKYGIDKIYGLGPEGSFLDDTFWPIVIGQTGALGIISYFLVLATLVCACLRLKKANNTFYMGAIYMLAYLLIASMAEPAFNNSVASPLAFLLGIIFRKSCIMEKRRTQDKILQ